MKKIFICYRTVDEPYAATLIDQVLVPRFGSDMVFRASRSIRVGDDFEEKIFEAIRVASVLLVVIGPHWLDARDEHGRRLDDPKDVVRREILTAFEHGVRVVPVLMNTRRLLPEELPDELSRLAKCQDVRINFRNAEYDLPALVERLTEVMDLPAADGQGTQPPVTRSLLVVDAEQVGERTGERRRVLHAIVQEALTSLGIAPDRIITESRGDRVVGVVDAELLNLLDTAFETLITALGKHNLARQDWLRLRVAVHRGLVHRDEHGWSGADLTEACTLLNSPQVGAVLARAERAQCALVVPDSVYDKLIVHGYGNLNANVYAKLDAGWIRVPGYPIPPVADDEPATTSATLPATPPLPAGMQVVGNLFHGNAIQHIDASVRRESTR